MLIPIRTWGLIAALIASPVEAAPVTPANIASHVRQSNPDLAAARLRIAEASGRARQSGRLTNPEVELTFEHDPRFRSGEIEVGFSQRFPVTRRLSLERRTTATLLQAAEAEVANVERELITQARARLIELLLLRERRDLLKAQVLLSGELADQLVQSREQGETSGLESGEARLEAAALSLELGRLDLQEASLLGELRPLLGTKPGASLAVAGPLPSATLPTRKGGSAAHRPDYRAARLEAEAARQETAVQRAKRYEDIGAGLYTRVERTPEQVNDAFIGLRLSLPLPLWNKNEGSIQEAAAKEERKAKEADALAQRIGLEADSAYAAMQQSLAALHQLDDQLIPLAREQEKAAREAWDSGQADLQTLFRMRRHHQQLTLSRLDLLREFHLARLRFQAAVGLPAK